MRLKEDFYCQDAVTLAQKLIGKLLCRKIDNEIIKARITETEAYYGTKDTACHAHKGKTPRNEIMYHKGGVTYIYLCYGMHNLLNVVSGKADNPEAVLIRGIENFDGPGKLTKHLNITRSLNKIDLSENDELWIEGDDTTYSFTATKRIGIDYAAKIDREKLWRFVIKL